MKKLSQKQTHRISLWIFIVAMLVGFALVALVNVQTAAKDTNILPVAADRTN